MSEIQMSVPAYGKAEFLFGEMPPADEAPRPDDQALCVAMMWGDTVIDVKTFAGRRSVAVGSAAANDFHVFSPATRASFELVASDGRAATLAVPAEASVALRRDGEIASREGLEAAGTLVPTGAGAAEMELGLSDRARVRIGPVTFVLFWTRRKRPLRAGPLLDFYFAKVLSLAFMAHLALLAVLLMTDAGATRLTEDLWHSLPRIVHTRTEQAPRPRRFAGVDEVRPRGEKGRFGRERASAEDAAPSRPGAPNLDVDKRERDRLVVDRAVRGLFGSNAALSHLLGPGGLGTDINRALGGMRGGGLVDQFGFGGLGTRGLGPGGGGEDLRLGAIGGRPGGYGGGAALPIGARSGPGRHAPPPREPVKVVGACQPSVIGRAIALHASQIRYCYETELSRNPDLSGKLAVSFTIDGSGEVAEASLLDSNVASPALEQCVVKQVLRWRFPEPGAGRQCVITYPWVFRRAGAD